MYKVLVADSARRDLSAMFDWLAAHSPSAADQASAGIQLILRRDLRHHPNRYAYFWLTGSPCRGRLFQISRNTKFWIVYRVDEPSAMIRVFRIWNASRDPARFEV